MKLIIVLNALLKISVLFVRLVTFCKHHQKLVWFVQSKDVTHVQKSVQQNNVSCVYQVTTSIRHQKHAKNAMPHVPPAWLLRLNVQVVPLVIFWTQLQKVAICVLWTVQNVMTLLTAHHVLTGIISTVQPTNAFIVHQNSTKVAFIAMLPTVCCVKVGFTWPIPLSTHHLKSVKAAMRLMSSVCNAVQLHVQNAVMVRIWTVQWLHINVKLAVLQCKDVSAVHQAIRAHGVKLVTFWTVQQTNAKTARLVVNNARHLLCA